MKQLWSWDQYNYEWLDDPSDPMLAERAKEEVLAYLAGLVEYHETAGLDAAEAESYAADCLAAAREGRWDDALEAAQAASDLELEYGDHPTWGPLRHALEEAAKKVQAA